MLPDDDQTTDPTEITETAPDSSSAESASSPPEGGGEDHQGSPPANSDGVQDKPPLPPWLKQRFAETSRDKYEAIKRAEAAESREAMLRRQLEAINGAPSDPPADADGKPAANRPTINVLPSDEIDRRATEKATQIAANRAFTEACNATNAAGEKAHADFGAARDALSQAFGDKLQGQPEFFETITALPNGHEVFYRLGKDLDKAADLLSMPRTKMIVELTRMDDQVERAGKQRPVSKAPPPLKTIDGAGRSPEVDPEKMSTADWMKWREKESKRAHDAKYAR